MTLLATIRYKGKQETFKVSDAGHGREWAATRAIAHFFYLRPALLPKKGNTPMEIANIAIMDGLTIKLEG